MSRTEGLVVAQTDHIQNHGNFRKQITEIQANYRNSGKPLLFSSLLLKQFWVVNEVADKMQGETETHLQAGKIRDYIKAFQRQPKKTH